MSFVATAMNMQVAMRLHNWTNGFQLYREYVAIGYCGIYTQFFSSAKAKNAGMVFKLTSKSRRNRFVFHVYKIICKAVS